MIIDWIYNKLIEMRDQKRHEVLKLKWQQAELEKLINDKKRENKQ